MRQTQIFSGSSHPELVDGICERLGQRPGQSELRKFSNGETSVQIQTSIRNQDVFIVQSGSSKINDNVMELLIMISACKGGSARHITAVMPYFPYSRQSKKKSHRGAITARMIANLLNVAGVDHVITIDLHASQMQGFFKCPVDNLVAEPLLARWIKHNVLNWNDAVVVSKNPGGTKRVTSLADALKLSFGIVTTDRRRFNSANSEAMMNGSIIFERYGANLEADADDESEERREKPSTTPKRSDADEERSPEHRNSKTRPARTPSNPYRRLFGADANTPSSPLAKSTRPDSSPEPTSIEGSPLIRSQTAPMAVRSDEHLPDEAFTDERARDVIHGRFVHGHIVDEDFPSPSFSAQSVNTPHHRPQRTGSDDDDAVPENMLNSFISTASSRRYREHALGGSGEVGATSEDEEEDLKNPELETTVTLVGNVKDRPVFIMDDMIDKSGSWIAAAETCIKRGGATKVYCMATHGLFGGDCLEEMEECDCIDGIIVTNSFPIPMERREGKTKLTVLGVENLLAEAIRRNHYGESISQLFMHYD